MFSDNKSLIGHNWLYDYLSESMKNFNESAYYDRAHPYLDIHEVRGLLMKKGFDSEETQTELKRLLNYDHSSYYMEDDEAVLVHQYLMSQNAFTANQWDKLCPFVKVFDYNADFRSLLNYIVINAESYIIKYADDVLHELNRGILAVLKISRDDFEVMFEMFEKSFSHKDETFLKLIHFLGDCLLDFYEKWPDDFGTAQKRLSKYIASIASVDNPYWTIFPY